MKNQELRIKNKVIFFIIFLFVIGLFGYLFIYKNQSSTINQPSNQQPNKQLTTVKIAMGYIPNVQFTPFYVAIDKGYFENNGLEIEFNYSMETNIITLLAKGELDFGIASGDQVILANAQELPVINIFSWYQRFPVVLVSLKNKNIENPADLIGKTIGTPAMQGASYIGLQGLLKSNNINDSQIKLQNIGYTQVESLTANKVDVAVGYAMNEVVQLVSQGYQINVLAVADFINFVSNGLITSKNIVEEKPDLAGALVAAFNQGLNDTLANPDEAFTISKKYIPEMQNEEIQKEVLKASIAFWQAEKLGANKKEQWQKSVDFLKKIGLIETNPIVENLYTNQFIK